ncbi:hypothetical protein, partial [Ruminococcus sp.]|uniref:hypothetical protein n=1 Tax=Ruminococcus sp. TaxID=41978 RepID=UPI003AB5D264
PTWFEKCKNSMVDNAGFANKKQATSGHLYKKFIADRRCHNSSFLTPHSTNAAFFIKNLLQFKRYCAILTRYV